VARYFFLLLLAFTFCTSISNSMAGPHFGPPPHYRLPGGVAYSEYHHRPYYYRRYHYAPVYRSPVRHPNRLPHR
jgi:hypothetical protein